MLYHHHLACRSFIIVRGHHYSTNSLFKYHHLSRLFHLNHYQKKFHYSSLLSTLRRTLSSQSSTSTTTSDLKFARPNVYDTNSITINGLNSNLEKLQYISTLIVQLSTVRDITQVTHTHTQSITNQLILSCYLHVVETIRTCIRIM